jgi:tetratricopeptide (TPR) repeat protein
MNNYRPDHYSRCGCDNDRFAVFGNKQVAEVVVLGSFDRSGGHVYYRAQQYPDFARPSSKISIKPLIAWSYLYSRIRRLPLKPFCAMKTTILCCFLALAFHCPALTQPVTTTASQPVNAPPADRQQELIEMSRLLTATGNYEDAYYYYGYLLQYQQSLELYNNAGVTTVLHALSYFRTGEPEVRFRYPLELDAELPGARGGQDYVELRRQLLEKALRYFDEALRLNPAYAPAHLNKACALTLLGHADRAAAYVDGPVQTAARQAGFEKTARDAGVLRGIVYALRGDEVRARTAFEQAAQQGSRLGAINRAILLKERWEAPPPPLVIEVASESIDRVTLEDPYNLPEANLGGGIVLSPQIRFFRDLEATPHARFYFNENAGTTFQTYFLVTKPGYNGRTVKELGIGATAAQIQAAYGEPTRTLETAQGRMLYYAKRALLLMVDSEGKLVQWAIAGTRTM